MALPSKWNFNIVEPVGQEDYQRPSTHYDAVARFQDAIASSGLGRPDIESTGDIQRFHVEGDARGSLNGWYVFFPEGIPAGSFGSWKADEKHTWCAKSREEMSPQEAEAFRIRMERAREMRRLQVEQEHNDKAKAAQDFIQKLPTATDCHAYLSRKGVPALPGLLLSPLPGELIMPYHDNHGVIWGYQGITKDGGKKCHGKKKGNFFHIDGDLSKIYIAEGYATAATIFAGTGCLTIVAIDAGNLRPVAESVRDTYPAATIVIAADDDRFTKKPDGTPWNPGVEHANEAAQAINASVVKPRFTTLDASLTDFNDLMLAEGLDEVKRQLGIKTSRITITDWGIDQYEGKAPDYTWAVKDVMPSGVPGLLAAAGDTGKGLLTLELALQIAGAKHSALAEGGGWFGHEVEATGGAVIFTAEDNHAEVHRRLNALDPKGTRRRAVAGRLFVIPLPDSGGPCPLVSVNRDQPVATPMFEEIKRQLLSIKDLAFVNFDPLASFVCADINSDPAVGAFTTGLLASLSTETGATIMVAHHTAKTKDDINTPEQARTLIRGSTAIVDGVRFALSLWPVGDKSAHAILENLSMSYSRNMVFRGAVVKANGPADRNIKTFIRAESGLLVCRDVDIKKTTLDRSSLLDMLEDAIAEAAENNSPFHTTGNASLFGTRRPNLPEPLPQYDRGQLQNALDELIETKRVVLCNAGRVIAKYIDVPAGKYATGFGNEEIKQGAIE